ncbi:MAG: hypothetical protein H0X25_13835 [Acidobacteriales bacterium]|nr:hypothetical protein [Terriglobales bacterium]
MKTVLIGSLEAGDEFELVRKNGRERYEIVTADKKYGLPRYRNLQDQIVRGWRGGMKSVWVDPDNRKRN